MKPGVFGRSVIFAIAYGNDKFVAAGSGGKIAFSPDGIRWTLAESGLFGGSAIHALVYGGGKWLAGGDDGKMAYSTDGVAWTAITSGVWGPSVILGKQQGSAAVCNLAYGGLPGAERYVAYFDNQTTWAYRLAWSTDGLKWTQVSLADNFFSYRQDPHYRQDYHIAWGGGKFVLAGGGGIAVSADGAKWTEVGSGGGSSIGFVPVYGAGKWAVIGNGASYSADGTRWTLWRVNGASYSRSRNYSTDGGASWMPESSDLDYIEADGLQYTLPTASGDRVTVHFLGAAYGVGRFVSVGYEGAVAYSELQE